MLPVKSSLLGIVFFFIGAGSDDKNIPLAFFLQCFEDIYIDEKPVLKEILYYLNIVFAVLFFIEMIMKWIALGFKKYFSSFWTIMDFSIVVVSGSDITVHAASYLCSFRV